MELETLHKKVIFSAFSGKYDGNREKGHSIMDTRDDVIFLWDNSSGCVLTQGIKAYCTDHQELRPTEQPSFDVTNIAVNISGTKIALWGSAGACVIELPWRCGPRLEYQDGKDEIIVKCRHLDLLDLGVGDDVLQVRWDPHSRNDNLLCVLASDNAVYCLDCSRLHFTPVKTIRIGSRPLSRHNTLSVLGETAIDFSFITLPSIVPPPNQPTTILVLKGNGDVCIFGPENDSDFADEQMLPISPLADDNYLSEACSLMVLPSKPPCVVIATSRGVIYHTLLVALDIDHVAISPDLRQYRLLVIESVVLDPGLQMSNDDFNFQIVRLLQDEGHLRRYVAIHPAGVHSVVVDVLMGVQKLIKSSEHESEFRHDSEMLDNMSSRKMPESILEYLLCTSRPVQGCIVFPGALLAIDSESDVVQLPMRTIELQPFHLFDEEAIGRDEPGPLTQQMRKPFSQQLEQMIHDSRVLPRMGSIPKDMTQEQLLGVVVGMANLVRKVTIPRYKKIRSILAQRQHLIISMKKLQLQEIAELEQERLVICESTANFGERIQMIVEGLEEQKARLLTVVHRLAERKPVPSDAERRMDIVLSEIEKNVDEFSETLLKLKKTRAYQDSKIVSEIDNREMALSTKQGENIRACLTIIGENISQVVKKVTEVNSMLGLSLD